MEVIELEDAELSISEGRKAAEELEVETVRDSLVAELVCSLATNVSLLLSSPPTEEDWNVVELVAASVGLGSVLAASDPTWLLDLVELSERADDDERPVDEVGRDESSGRLAVYELEDAVSRSPVTAAAASALLE